MRLGIYFNNWSSPHLRDFSLIQIKSFYKKSAKGLDTCAQRLATYIPAKTQCAGNPSALLVNSGILRKTSGKLLLPDALRVLL